jgi:hypothetical protein
LKHKDFVFLTWYQSIDDQMVMNLNLTTLILTNKINKIAQKNGGFVQVSNPKSFHLKGCVK